MLYELSSPAFTLAALAVLGGIVYTAKTFFDRRMASLNGNGDGRCPLEQAEA